MVDIAQDLGTTTRWVAVGSSCASDAAAAAREAVGDALSGDAPALLVLFSSPRYDLQVVAQTARELTGPGVEIVGCTTAGEIAGERAGSGSLVAIALGGAGITVRTAVGALADGPRAAGMAAASGMDAIDSPHRAMLLLVDGLGGGRGEIVRGAYGVTGAGVPLVGGAAGDDLRMRQTHQLHGDRVLTGAVVGVAIGSDAPIGVGVGHGWRRVGEPIVVTESTGSLLVRLDDEPALDHYLRRVGAPPEAFHDPQRWQTLSLSHPLGLPRPGGEEVRAILGADYPTRSLVCGDVPQGTLLWVMAGDASTVMQGTDDACRDALSMLGGHEPVGLVAFDCAARRALLGADGIAEEARRIAAWAPGVPLGGFYTYGEIARTSGSRGVHNATLVMLAVA
jgi:hypothetical protein